MEGFKALYDSTVIIYKQTFLEIVKVKLQGTLNYKFFSSICNQHVIQ